DPRAAGADRGRAGLGCRSGRRRRAAARLADRGRDPLARLAHRRPRARRDPRGARGRDGRRSRGRLPAAHRPLGAGPPREPPTAPRSASLADTPPATPLAPPEPCPAEVLSPPPGKTERAPEPIAQDAARLRAALEQPPSPGLVLIGRRHVRSNNSWMHNVGPLVSGRDRCTLQVHPDDAAALGLEDGGLAEAASRGGKLPARVEVRDEAIRQGVSLAHG